MKIGLDFDDVTAHLVGPILEWSNIKYNRNDKIEHVTNWELNLVWDISKDDAIKRVAEFHSISTPQNTIPLEDAIPSIKKLLEKHEIIVITGRPPRFKQMVEEWFLHHLNTKLRVIIAGEFIQGQASSKSEICTQLGIPILLEDAPSTALSCADAGVKVLLFDREWNQGTTHKNIVRVKNWKEAVKEIGQFEKEYSHRLEQ
jgi:uncharacterized HAD superfamily protein